MRELVQNEDVLGIIYKAENIVNGKIYVGMTRQSLQIRKQRHLSSARNNPNTSIYFWRALNKYGGQGFKWETIDVAYTESELQEKEKYWISYYQSYGDGGYNLTTGGEGISGYRLTEERKEQQSQMLKNMWKNGLSESMVRGSGHHSATLTEKEVLEIKELLIENEISFANIAKLYNTSTNAINPIKAGRTWKHLITDDDRSKMPKKSIPKYKVIPEVVKKKVLTYLDMNKFSYIEIAERLNISKTTVLIIKKIHEDVFDIMDSNIQIK